MLSSEGLQVLYGSKSWIKTPHLRNLYARISIIMMASMVNGYDGSLINGIQTIPTWLSYFENPQGTLLGMLGAALALGAFCSCFFAPFVTDGLGRKWTIIIGCCIMITATMIQTFAVNVAMYIAARAMLGFGAKFAGNAGPLLTTELAHPKQRATITAVYQSMYYLGGVLSGWICYGSLDIPGQWAWRTPTIMQAFPPVYILCLIALVPESPRWLIGRGRIEEAKTILVKYHGGGDENDELVLAELVQIQEAIAHERTVAASSIKALFRSPGNRKRMLICALTGIFSQWAGSALISYYLTTVLRTVGIVNPRTQALINGGLQISNFIFALTGAYLSEKLGRRVLLLGGLSFLLVTFSTMTGVTAYFTATRSATAANAVIALIFLYNMFYNSSWACLCISYPVEILPFHIRAKGQAFNQAVAYLAIFINVFVNPIAMAKISYHYYIVFIVIIMIQIVVIYFLFPETKGRSLEEIAVCFDGPAAIGLATVDMRHEEDGLYADKKGPDSSVVAVEPALMMHDEPRIKQ